MKSSITHHEECYQNSLQYLETLRQRMVREVRDYFHQRERVSHYAAQIAEAKRRKKNGFDPDRFMSTAPDAVPWVHVVCNNDAMLSAWLDEEGANAELTRLKSEQTDAQAYYHIHAIRIGDTV